MQSRAWLPGNKYGDAVAPRYNAISYTWGRFELQQDSDPSVTGLEVGGVDWNIPRIDPSHFTKEQFHRVVQAATYVSPGYYEDTKVREDVEFVWLDVACIDQRFTKETMLEIGRQAMIFSNATCVYVWLSHTPQVHLCDLFKAFLRVDKEISDFEEQLTYGDTDTDADRILNMGPYPPKEWLDSTAQVLERLVQDPWFASLWTLQEAFLCKTAVFLSQEGLAAAHNQIHDVFTLNTAIESCAGLVDFFRNVADQTPDGRNAAVGGQHRILQLIEALGFEALVFENPMELYNAASSRRPTRELDRIYGIMQVFGFRLGASDPNAHPSLDFTLPQLEEQLGQALVDFNALLSQAFIDMSGTREAGSRWRPGGASITPSYDGLVPWKPESMVVSCEMQCFRENGVFWGHIRGRALSLEAFEQIRERVDQRLREEIRDFHYMTDPFLDDRTRLWKALDWAPDLFPQWESREDYFPTMAGELLLPVLGTQRVKIFHLGYLPGSAPGNDYGAENHYGLLLLYSDNPIPHWRRLGICGWSARDWTPDGYQKRRPESQEGLMNVSEVVYDGLPQTHILNTSSTWYSMLPVSEEWEVIDGLLG